MTLKEFLSVLNIKVKYRVIDRFNKKRVELKPYREDKETYNNGISRVWWNTWNSLILNNKKGESKKWKRKSKSKTNFKIQI